MAIPERFIDELVARSDIADVVGEYVRLTPKGGSLWGLCPFHNEKTPSFHVLPSRQLYKCFGCGKGGGVINFIMEVEHLPYVEAIRHLAKRAGMEVPDTGTSEDYRKKYRRAVEANTAAARFYYGFLGSEGGKAVRDYLVQRKISRKYANRFGLGAAPGEWDGLIRALTAQGFSKTELMDAGLAVAGKNGGVYDKFRSRLMLPVIDVRGDVVGFTSRILPGLEGAKYLNSPDTLCFKKSQLIYALNLAKTTKRPNLILVEGNIDVITLHQAGFDNVVATMGTALTADHARILSRFTKELVLCYDNDEAGKKSTERVLTILRDADLGVRVLQLPNAFDPQGKPIKQDPDDFIKKFGAAAFEKCLSGSTGQNDYRLEVLLGQADLSTDEGKMAYLRAAVETVGRLSSPIEREIYGGRAAAAAGVTPKTFAQEVDRWRRAQARQSRKKEERRDLVPASARQPRARELRYENLRSALAEEGILRLFCLDPTLFSGVAVHSEEFSSALLRKVYDLLRDRCDRGLSPGLSALAGELTAEEMNHLVEVLNQPEDLSQGKRALQDYINIIHAEAGQRRSPVKSAEALMALRNQQRDKMEESGT